MDELNNNELELMAQTFVSELLRGDFKSAASKFDKQMNDALSEDKLMDTWHNLIKDAGALLDISPTKTVEMECYKIVVIKCAFQQTIIDIQVVYNESKEISGLTFNPTNFKYNTPEYVVESNFDETDVTVGDGKWAVPGTLTVPNGEGPFPGVVLVHGSGPNDRDETIGPNKTFKDLAWGMASKGIAVLRYDKRTLKHGKELTPEMIATLTVKEEVIDDALLAVKLLRENEKVKSDAVFLLGHSLGATVAPRIGQEDGSIAGLIMMAAITRTLEETILDQYTYIFSLAGEITEEQKAEMESLRVKVDRLKDLTDSDELKPEDLPLGIPLDYWLDLHKHDVVEAAEKLSMPILIMQGGRDYQVLESKDFTGWKRALEHKDNVSFKLFPTLNHLFVAGDGISTPQEYLNEGHVDPEVISFIVNWIKEK